MPSPTAVPHSQPRIFVHTASVCHPGQILEATCAPAPYPVSQPRSQTLTLTRLSKSYYVIGAANSLRCATG